MDTQKFGEKMIELIGEIDPRPTIADAVALVASSSVTVIASILGAAPDAEKHKERIHAIAAELGERMATSLPECFAAVMKPPSEKDTMARLFREFTKGMEER